MDKVLLINSFCKIRQHKVWLNDKLLYDDNAHESLQVFLKNCYKNFEIDYPKYFKMDSLCKLGFLCAEILIKNESSFNSYASEDIGLILSNSNSSLDTDIKYNDTIKEETNYFPSPSLFVYTLPNIMVGEISIRHKITGENNLFVSQQFDSDFLYTYVNELFSSQVVQCVICGWIDVLDDKYEATLFFIKNEIKENIKIESVIFEPENIIKLFT